MDTSKIHRRDTNFERNAGGYDAAVIGLESVWLFVGLVQIGLSILAIFRSTNHRAPFVVLAIAVACFTLGQVLVLPVVVIPYALDRTVSDTDARRIFHVTDGLRGAAAFFKTYATVFALASSFLVLWSRRTAALGRGQSAKKILDGVLLAIFAIITFVRVVYVAAETNPSAILYGRLSVKEINRRNNIALSLGHAYLAIYVLAVIDFAASALLLRVRISRDASRDTPTNRLAFLLAPLWILHVTYLFFLDVWSALQVEHPVGLFSRAQQLIVAMTSTVEGGVVHACIFAVLLSLGLSRTIWDALGDHPRKTLV